jgi:pimeloyl-ACP methyl ester carboxylesterase
MKKIFTFFLSILIGTGGLLSQETGITGTWEGIISLGDDQLKLVVHLAYDQDKLVSTLDSPDQMAIGIPVESASFDGEMLRLGLTALQASYQGVLVNSDNFAGKWMQAGMTFDLNLKRNSKTVSGPNRPQLPKPPFPYATEEVVIHNDNAGVSLSGTLTVPRGSGPHPAVVLISGSGPQNRDEEIAGHKPFLVLADFLTRNGIATLRYDDRGVAGSTGDFSSATSLDFMEDATAALKFLRAQKRIDNKKCGLLGHSEGGMIAQMMAAENKDIAFVVLLAAPGVPTPRLLLTQAELIGKAQGASEKEIKTTGESNAAVFEILRNEKDLEKARLLVDQEMEKLAAKLSGGDTDRKALLEQQLKASTEAVFTPWFLFFINFTPEQYLSKIKCPVLALIGEKDTQVEADENIAAIQSILQANGNSKVTAKVLPGLNHLFQTAQSGAPREYAQIEETFATSAMQLIAEWLRKQ